MIKYPVNYRGYFDTVIVVEDSAGNEVCQCPSIENAELIAKSLNDSHMQEVRENDVQEVFRETFARLKSRREGV